MSDLGNDARAGGGLTTPERVRAVIANPDPVRRNLQITLSYHELTRALGDRVGGPDLVWTAFAIWASKQAGSFIRNEEVPGALRRFLDLDTGHRRHRWWTPGWLLRRQHFLVYTRLTVEDVSTYIAQGNHLVYTRLAPIFADFLILARELERPDPARLEAFLAAVMERDPSIDERLRRAFTHFHAALFETDAEAKAELVFLANVLVGWHEQARLQESLDGALAAPIRRALDDPERRFLKWPIPAPVRRLSAAAFRTVFAPAIHSFEKAWKRAATECLMTLGLPGARLQLGDDVPPLADGEMYPAALREIANPEARAVLAELDSTPDTLRGSAARDWSSLADRMNYIADFFRSRQQESELLLPPFTAAQAQAIRDGRLPEGEL